MTEHQIIILLMVVMAGCAGFGWAIYVYFSNRNVTPWNQLTFEEKNRRLEKKK